MRPRTAALRGIFSLVLLGMAVAACAQVSYAQGNGYERTFPQSKATIEKMLQEIPTAGRLPVLDGFAVSSSAAHPLDRYRRGYYESKFQVIAAPGGGSVVRVVVEVTAWYADPVAAKSGYQLLTSNGRIEGDVLDQLADQLAANNCAAESHACGQDDGESANGSPHPVCDHDISSRIVAARVGFVGDRFDVIPCAGGVVDKVDVRKPAHREFAIARFVDSLIGTSYFGAGAEASRSEIVNGTWSGGSGKESSAETAEES